MTSNPHFEPIDDLGEFYRKLHAREAQSMGKLHLEQKSITWGSYWMLPLQDLLIFGYCYTEAENQRTERELGAPADELEWTMRNLREAHERGYRYSNNYSIVCPDGEIGSNHVSRMWPITEDQFRDAELGDWEPQLILAKGGTWLRNKLLEMYHAFLPQKEQ